VIKGASKFVDFGRGLDGFLRSLFHPPQRVSALQQELRRLPRLDGLESEITQ
jgi:hypothetical protein